MRPLLIAVGLVVLLAAGWLGWNYYVYQKLASVLSAPQLKLVATKFVPVPMKEIRRVNLGYGTITLPASIIGNPVTVYPDNPAIIIRTDQDEIPPLILMMPPVKASKLGDEMIKSMQQTTDTPIPNFFELQKMTVAAQPFSFLEMLQMRPRKLAERGMLLTMKSIQVLRDSSTVEIMERHGAGALVHTTPSRILVEIVDWEHDTMQGVTIFNADVTRAREIVSALLSDYSMPLADDSHAALMHLINEAKIPPAPPRETAEPASLTPAR